eukprot:CAMPEP_0178918936 /NCGR_PEP_ID=MMETSP0786-20121207/14118_1 /TAXON_ID=186022 /ORGANISM="Thalassionema frauenfeldii, Strain CCMP 1798" /LENGTH=170 /DNA_ID=CAMNT_0020592731 /DNA_START=75 /DNA_END=587 /DNA_ORIENTATION=-
MRDELNQQLDATANSLDMAMNQVKATTEQYEHESQRRCSLEDEVERLTTYYKQQILNLSKQHKKEISSLTSNWERERTCVLDEIQEGCTDIINARRRKPAPIQTFSTSLPENHEQFQFSVLHSTEDQSAFIRSPTSQTTATSITAASTSVSQSLAETEAFVQKVLGGNVF